VKSSASRSGSLIAGDGRFEAGKKYGVDCSNLSPGLLFYP
jgi:hypothetical protein